MFSLFPEGLHDKLNGLIQNKNSSLFQRRPVKEILWGYKDPILNIPTGLFVPVSKDIKAILQNNKQPWTFKPLTCKF